MIEKFKNKLSDNGQSLKWFYEKFIKERTGLSYSGFTAQLNGYAPVSDIVKAEIWFYMKDLNESDNDSSAKELV